MKKTINLKEELKGFGGESFEPALTVGKALANILNTRKNDSDPMRTFLLAKDLYTKETIDLDQSNISFIHESIKANENYLPVVRGQLMMILENAEKSK